ncbi:YesL family protein [Cellulomonas hominis]|uniref:YesL family protein n=1 Tax=Cellulomonas hominis TaxID=156981 RepID=UPI001B8E364F|nr:YesL family protein [Cellulomonas hominis]VTR78745.1 hypothetical protein CHMI_03529 [Cellulomonas hominis]
MTATVPARVTVHDGGEDVPGWAGAIMRWLRVAVRVVAVNLLAAAGTLLGGVLLGVLPALAAAQGVLAASTVGDPPASTWRAFWSEYRGGFRRVNRLGAPLLAAGVALVADVLALPVLAGGGGPGTGGPGTGGPGATGAAAVAAAGVLLLGAAVLVLGAWFLPVVRRYDEPFGRTWRFLLLAPPSSPGTSLAVLVTVGAVAFVGWHVTALLPLGAVAVALLLTGLVVDRRLDAIDARS